MRAFFKLYCVLILIELMLVGGIIGCAIAVSRTPEIQGIIDRGEVAEAEIDSYALKSSLDADHHSHSYYQTYYKYVDENGTVYSGIADFRLNTREEAESRLGAKVSIYLGDDGYSILVGYDNSNVGLIIAIAILSALAAGLLVFLIVFPVVLNKKYEKKAEAAEGVESERSAQPIKPKKNEEIIEYKGYQVIVKHKRKK